MRTVAEIDGKIDEFYGRIEKLKEERKAAAAKERQQTRKWRGMCLSAIGETVVRAIGCNWAELNLEGLQDALNDIGGDLLSGAVIEGRSPAEAKKALDAFKRLRKSGDSETDGGESAPQETAAGEPVPDEDTAQTDADESDGAYQERPW